MLSLSYTSYDIVSLFACMLLNETIDFFCICVCQHSTPAKCSKNVYLFQFEGIFLCQIDGVTMGGPLGPTLAMFIGPFRKAIYETAFYSRLLDDIFFVSNFRIFANFLKFYSQLILILNFALTRFKSIYF